MFQLPDTIETVGGYEIVKIGGFGLVGIYQHPKTGEFTTHNLNNEKTAKA